MTDFEDRLSTALRSAGEEAPDAHGLASAARRRARARRSRTALTSVAAVVAVAGVAGVVSVLGGGESAPQVTDDPTSTTEVVESGQGRVESWRDISVTVPDSWGHGSLDDWCADDGKVGEPVVERPGGASVDILCDPQLGYGVQFGDGAAFDAAEPPGRVWRYGPVEDFDVVMYPDGAWLGYQRTNGALVQVSARTRAEAVAILASFVRNASADANGCTAHAAHTGPSVAEGSVRLCRYGIDDWLEQSEVLTGQDAADAVEAVTSAPAKADRMCTMALTGPRIRVTTADAEGWVTLDACHGFAWVDGDHDLTADVLYWVLSPGWTGGVEGDVPMPEKLRR